MATPGPLESSDTARSIRRGLELGLVIGISFAVYLASPCRQVGDSQYSLLLSRQLLSHGTFRLDAYFGGPSFPEPMPPQIELVGDHAYYVLPPGSSVLSIPFVALLERLGISPVAHDGRYDPDGEAAAEAFLSALLTASTAGVLFATARMVVPLAWAVAVWVAAGFGSQLWSTASRAMWSDTWGVLLLALALNHLVAAEQTRARLRPWWLGTLCAWAFFAKPTYLVAAICIAGLLFARGRRIGKAFCLSHAAWLAGFVAYAWLNYGQLLPNDYRASRLNTQTFAMGLAGNLVSPSRGLVVFVPWLLVALFLVIRHRRELPLAPLALAALAAIVMHLLVLACFPHWYGGYSYGPRLATGLVPWASLSLALGIGGWLLARPPRTSPLHGLVGGLAIVTSVAIHARGALSIETYEWNSVLDVDNNPAALWDWRYPQFIAGLIDQPPPRIPVPYAPGTTLAVGTEEAGRHLGFGWGAPEGAYRWTVAPRAVVFLGSGVAQAAVLRMTLEPFLAKPSLARQRVFIDVSGSRVGSLDLDAASPAEHAFLVPRGTRSDMVVALSTPDAAAPHEFGLGPDRRRLGVALHWLRLDALPVLPTSQTLTLGSTTAAPFLGDGWSLAEGAYRWSLGSLAEVYFGIAKAEPLLLRLHVGPGPQASDAVGQRVQLELNGAPIGARTLNGPEVRTLTFCLDGANLGEANVLRILTPPSDSSAPPAQPASDPRTLGVAVHWLRLDPFPPWPEREGLALGSRASEPFLVRGWGAPEGAYRWVVGTEAELAFALADTTASGLRLRLWPYLEPGALDMQPLQLTLNGRALPDLELNDARVADYVLDLPPGALRNANVLTLRTPNARAPSSLGRSHDSRPLGVAVLSMRLER